MMQLKFTQFYLYSSSSRSGLNFKIETASLPPQTARSSSSTPPLHPVWPADQRKGVRGGKPRHPSANPAAPTPQNNLKNTASSTNSPRNRANKWSRRVLASFSSMSTSERPSRVLVVRERFHPQHAQKCQGQGGWAGNQQRPLQQCSPTRKGSTSRERNAA